LNHDNPYAPPTAAVQDTDDEAGDLAGRGQRFGAALIDGFIGLIAAVPIMLALGTFAYLRAGQPIPTRLTIISALCGFAVFLAIHGYLLKTNGQTVGKRLIGIKIVDLDDRLPSFGKVVGLRYLPITLVTLVPIAGQFLPLVDVLFIFRKDRRCIHDLIAGTRVVRAK
jgi:uncharacterized RDD family membrane protein YckC